MSKGQEKAVFNVPQILTNIPAAAFPLPVDERLFLYMKQYGQAGDPYHWNMEITIPQDSTVETTYSQFSLLDKNNPTHSILFEYKIYLTRNDTFLISTHRTFDTFPLVDQIPRQKVSNSVHILRMNSDGSMAITLSPEIAPTDFAVSPMDSTIIANMIKNGEASLFLNFESQFQPKGLYFSLNDHTLNTGPFEPPITRAPKYFSDYKTKEGPFRLLVTPNGIVYEH